MKKKRISRILGVGVTLALLASLLVGVLPAAAVSTPLLTIPTAGDNVINTVNADYNVYFNLNKELGTGDTIDIVFPTGYTVGAPTATIAASDGWIGGSWLPAVVTGVTFSNPATRTIRATLAGGTDAIGEMSNVRISITAGVTNPSATGAYAVSVKTSQETTPVTSNDITLIPPVIPPLPGVVTGYNSVGETLFQSNSGTAIVNALATAGVVRVTLDSGTYAESPTIGAGQTVVSTAGAATAIITGVVTVNSATAVLDDVTVTGGVVGAVAGATVRNCVLSNAAGAALTANAGIISSGNTISAAAGQSGLVVNVAATSTGDTYNPAATGTAITANANLTLTNATITGASGTGLTNVAGTATVTGSMFSNLNIAINATGGVVNISTSTIDGCGNATTPTGAIQIAGGVVGVMANDITNGPGAIGRVSAAGSGTGSQFKFNTLTGNVGAFVNGGAGTLDATNNWWGSSAGPTVASTGLVLTTPWLIAEITNPTVLYGNANVLASHPAAQATSGVTVAIVLSGAGVTGMHVVATGNYASNPVTAEPPADTVKSYEVYIQGPAAEMVQGQATITFFGITSPNAAIYAYSENQDTYVLCSNQRVDMFNGSVVVTVNGLTYTGAGAGLTIPNLGNMSGLEFVLTEPSIAPLAAPTTPSPALGADDVDVDPSFTWAAVAGADSYEFQIAEESDIPGVDPYTIPFDAKVVTTNGCRLTEDMKYDTTYVWRVRAVRGTEKGPWMNSFLTTMEEVPPEEAPTWVIEQEPTQIEWPEDITITVPPIEQTEIPEYILWVVVGIGAVLVIAVIVLIVRTRRVA